MGCVTENCRALESLLTRFCSQAFSQYSTQVHVSGLLCVTPANNSVESDKVLSLVHLDKTVECQDANSQLHELSLETLPPAKRKRGDYCSGSYNSHLKEVSSNHYGNDSFSNDESDTSVSTDQTSVASNDEQTTPLRRQASSKFTRRTSLVFKRNLGPRAPVKRCRLSTPDSRCDSNKRSKPGDSVSSSDSTEETGSPSNLSDQSDSTFIEKSSEETHTYENVSNHSPSLRDVTPTTPVHDNTSPKRNKSPDVKRRSPFRLRRSVSPRRISPLRIPARPKQVYHPRRQSAGPSSGAQQCVTCGRHFSDEGKLRIHMRRHLGLRVFACQFCDFRFASKMELDAHQTWHTVSKDYVCKHCGGNFVTVALLREHEELVHVFSQPEPVSAETADQNTDWIFTEEDGKTTTTFEDQQFLDLELAEPENIYEELQGGGSDEKGFDFASAVDSIDKLSDIKFSDGLDKFDASSFDNSKNLGAIGSERAKARSNTNQENRSTDENRNAVMETKGKAIVDSLCGSADMTGVIGCSIVPDETPTKPPHKHKRRVRDMATFFKKLT